MFLPHWVCCTWVYPPLGMLYMSVSSAGYAVHESTLRWVCCTWVYPPLGMLYMSVPSIGYTVHESTLHWIYCTWVYPPLDILYMSLPSTVRYSVCTNMGVYVCCTCVMVGFTRPHDDSHSLALCSPDGDMNQPKCCCFHNSPVIDQVIFSLTS